MINVTPTRTVEQHFVVRLPLSQRLPVVLLLLLVVGIPCRCWTAITLSTEFSLVSV